MRIALIGDIHLFRLKVSPRRLLGKRLLGQGNLWLNRRFRFNHDLLAPLVERVSQLQPDLILCTGDVTTTSLEDEFEDIVRFFKPLSSKAPTVIVPGNHDRYTFRSAKKRRIETLLEGLMPMHFPHHRKLTDRWHLLGLDSARPQVMMSRGAIGPNQLLKAREILAGLTEDDGVIVLCHYPTNTPPGTPTSWAHDLADAHLLCESLEQCPARVVFMHGHIHRPWHWEKQHGQGQKFTCINAGAPCLISSHYPCGQGFWEVELPDDPAQELGLVHHVPTPEGHYGARPSREVRGTPNGRWHARRVTGPEAARAEI